MKNVLRCLTETLLQGQSAVYCRLVETRGSAPQKAGAAMLVLPNGAQVGTLGGGCVEAEVKRRSLAILASGEAEVARFQLDHDYGWDDGLICGGRMQILIEPLRESLPDYYGTLSQLVQKGQGGTEAIVFDESSSGLAARSSYLFDEQDQLVAMRHTTGDEVPPAILEHLRPIAARPRAYAASGIGYLPLLPRCRLLIVGGGHVGQAVGELAASLDFEVWVVDDREEFVTAERFPAAGKRIAGDMGQVLPDLEITPDTYCLIVTRGHTHDQEALYHLAERGARYVGMIGSRRKIKLIFDQLLSEGISASALQEVYAPLGIHIGSQTVPEIAVSICAELVAHRNRGGVVPGRPQKIELSAGDADG
jgi:xanthine dehydrogenase accessory factor